MHLTVFENAYLLQSIGWAVVNSFWQTGLLWIIYQSFAIDKRLSPLVKHHLSIILLIVSFIWFIGTIAINYEILANNSSSLSIFSPELVMLNQTYSLLPCLSLVYFSFLCYYAIGFAKKFYDNCVLQVSGLTRAPVEFRLFSASTALHLGIKKKVQVWISANVDVPCITGFLKPVILLPAAIVNNLSSYQVESILIHELAHIRRNDYIVNFLQSVIELFLFFNPFAVLLSKAAKKERENCCDDWVMNYNYNRHEYAKALLILEEQKYNQYLFTIGATTGNKSLLIRIKRLFDNKPQTSITPLNKSLLAACTFFLLIMVATVPSNIRSSEQKIAAKNNEESIAPNGTPVNAYNAELPNNFIVKPKPLQAAGLPNYTVAIKRSPKKQKLAQQPKKEYVEAYINEELINIPSPSEPVTTWVSDIEDSATITRYFVKVEEQQSGKKQKNTYYLELNSENGKVTVIPLIIFNKYNPQIKKETKIRKPATPLRYKQRINS